MELPACLCARSNLRLFVTSSVLGFHGNISSGTTQAQQNSPEASHKSCGFPALCPLDSLCTKLWLIFTAPTNMRLCVGSVRCLDDDYHHHKFIPCYSFQVTLLPSTFPPHSSIHVSNLINFHDYAFCKHLLRHHRHYHFHTFLCFLRSQVTHTISNS